MTADPTDGGTISPEATEWDPVILPSDAGEIGLRRGLLEPIPEPSANGDTPHAPLYERPAFLTVSYNEFVNRPEATISPLIGDGDDKTLLPIGGTLLLYGDGGVGKTTYTIDALAHLASGTQWLGFVPVPRPIRILLVENEGPRGPFRRSLGRKAESWEGADYTRNAHVLEEPWAAITLEDESFRDYLGQTISELEIDLLMLGPLATIGMKGGGTPDEINAFSELLRDIQRKCTGDLAYWIIHHENKAGDISGAWNRVPDTLIHLTADTNGSTRVSWKKARYWSELHQTSNTLKWGDNKSYELIEAGEKIDPTIRTLELLADGSWHLLRDLKATKGVQAANIVDALKKLLNEGRVEVVKGLPGTDPRSMSYRLANGDQQASLHDEFGDGFDGEPFSGELP